MVDRFGWCLSGARCPRSPSWAWNPKLPNSVRGLGRGHLRMGGRPRGWGSVQCEGLWGRHCVASPDTRVTGRKEMSRAGGGDRWGQVAGQQRGRGGGLAPPGDSPGLSALQADWLVPSPDLPPCLSLSQALAGGMTQPEPWSRPSLCPSATSPPLPAPHLSLSGGSTQDVIITNTRAAVPGPPGPAS